MQNVGKGNQTFIKQNYCSVNKFRNCDIDKNTYLRVR